MGVEKHPEASKPVSHRANSSIERTNAAAPKLLSLPRSLSNADANICLHEETLNYVPLIREPQPQLCNMPLHFLQFALLLEQHGADNLVRFPRLGFNVGSICFKQRHRRPLLPS